MTHPVQIQSRRKARHTRGGAAGIGRCMWLLVLVCWPVCAELVAAGPVAPEYKVKAQLLVNFATYVTWPEQAFSSTNSPVVIGVAGKDPFESFLEAAVEANSRNRRAGRALVVRRVGTEAEMKECHILFVASSERRRWRDVRQRLKEAPVLTVGEMDEFLEQGGVVNFLLKGQSVRFEISLESAKAAGLRLDARLLGVADSVRGKYD